jgi:hypothetical protein
MQFKIEGNVVVLEYLSDNSAQIDQRVPLIWTSCALGGQRPWFHCRCGRRVAILYAVGEGFDCRQCCGLAYDRRSRASQSAPSTRHLSAPRGELDIFSPFPTKPPGMHRKTYDRLRNRALFESQLAIEALRGS